MITNRPEDAARHDTGDVLAGGEVGISREHAEQLAPDPSDAGEVPAPSKPAARPQAGAGGSAAATSAPDAPTPGLERTGVPGRR